MKVCLVSLTKIDPPISSPNRPTKSVVANENKNILSLMLGRGCVMSLYVLLEATFSHHSLVSFHNQTHMLKADWKL